MLPVTHPCLFVGAFPKSLIGFLKKIVYLTNIFITLKSTFVQFPLLIMFTIPLLEFSCQMETSTISVMHKNFIVYCENHLITHYVSI